MVLVAHDGDVVIVVVLRRFVRPGQALGMIAAAALPVLLGSKGLAQPTSSPKCAASIPLVASFVSFVFVFVLCDRFGNVFLSPGSWELSAPWHDWPGVRRPGVWKPRRRLQAARRVSWDRCRGVRLGGLM